MSRFPHLGPLIADISYNILRNWSVFAAANYVHSRIDKNSSRSNTVGNESPYTPKYTINLGTQLMQSLNDRFSAIFRADYRITGPTWFHTIQGESVRGMFDLSYPGLGTANFSGSRRDAYGLLNLRGGIQTKIWSVTAFATNALNKKYLSELIPAPEFGGGFITPGDGRTVGVELGANF